MSAVRVRTKVIQSVIAVAMLVLCPGRAAAQFETSAVVGTIVDKQAAAVAGAKVTLTNSATGVSSTTVTDASGSFEFFTVRLGTYVVTAEKAGFSIALADNVQVSIGSRRRVDLTLEVGGVTETVEVTAGTAMLDTDNSQRGQVIRGDDLKQLPVINREYSALALLTTGVRPSALASSREGSFNVNGLRSTFNNFLIDGVDNNAYGTSNQGFSNQVMQPTPDAVGRGRAASADGRGLPGRHAHSHDGICIEGPG